MTLETLILSVAVLGTLQIAYRALKNMEARTVNGAPAWSSPDESDFVIESETDRAARRMKKDFDLDRAKSIMAMAEQFAANQAKALSRTFSPIAASAAICCAGFFVAGWGPSWRNASGCWFWQIICMSTLAEIEAAIPRLTVQELAELGTFVQAALLRAATSSGHSVLDIPAVSVGAILPHAGSDDLLDEMLESRK